MKPYDHIEHYVTGKLTGEDLQAFEKAIQEDPELKEMVENYDAIKDLSTGILEMELLQEVKKVTVSDKTAATEKETPVKKINPWKRYLIIGAAAVFIGLVIAFFSTQNDIDTVQIVQTYYEEPVFEGIKKSVSPEVIQQMDELTQAKHYFKLNRYQQSIDILEAHISGLKKGIHLDEVRFWLGHAYFKKKQYKKARTQFLMVNNNNPNCLVKLCDVLRGKEKEEILADFCTNQ